MVTWPWACPQLAGFQFGFRALRTDWFSVAFSSCNADQWGAAEVVLCHFSRLNPKEIQLYFRSNLSVTNMTVSCRETTEHMLHGQRSISLLFIFHFFLREGVTVNKEKDPRRVYFQTLEMGKTGWRNTSTSAVSKLRDRNIEFPASLANLNSGLVYVCTAIQLEHTIQSVLSRI